VINEVSSAFSDLSSESENAAEVRVRSERAVALRKRAFERAMDDGKWDWIAEHIGELENDAELRGRIAARAREEGLNDWICASLGAIADEYTVDAAIENNNWHWLGEHIWEMNEDMQEKLARAAAEAKQWGWLGHFEEKLSIKGCALEIARTAMENEERTLAAQIAANHLVPDEAAQLCREAGEKQDYESVELLLPLVSAEAMDEILSELARKQEWERVERFVQDAAAETVESLMEMAVDQGNFDAVDMLDRYL